MERGGKTALDYFEEFLKGTDASHEVQQFIAEARKSRLGLHQDLTRTKKVAKFRELLSGKEISTVPSIEEYGTGENPSRTHDGLRGPDLHVRQPEGFPKEAKSQIEDKILDKLFYFDDAETPEAQYETFMKLAGPYWMSCVTKNDDIPILHRAGNVRHPRCGGRHAGQLQVLVADLGDRFERADAIVLERVAH